MKIFIRKLNEFYRESNLYKELNENKDTDTDTEIETETDEPFIEIDDEYYIDNMDIHSYDDFIKLLKVIDYWMFNTIPDIIYEYIFNNKLELRTKYSLLSNSPFGKEINMIIYSDDNSHICTNAAGEGYLHLLKYAHKHNFPWSNMVYYTSIFHGRLDCLIYAFENKCPYKIDECFYTSIFRNQIPCLRFLLKQGFPILEKYVYFGMDYGGYTFLKIFHENGYVLNDKVCLYACETGNLESFKYAVKNHCSFNREECLKIVSKMYFDALTFEKDINNYTPSSKNFRELKEYIIQFK